jgi:hypothetical protein
LPEREAAKSNNKKSVIDIKRKEQKEVAICLFGGGRVLGNSLGTFRNGVLGQFTGEDQAD